MLIFCAQKLEFFLLSSYLKMWRFPTKCRQRNRSFICNKLQLRRKSMSKYIKYKNTFLLIKFGEWHHKICTWLIDNTKTRDDDSVMQISSSHFVMEIFKYMLFLDITEIRGVVWGWSNIYRVDITCYWTPIYKIFSCMQTSWSFYCILIRQT